MSRKEQPLSRNIFAFAVALAAGGLWAAPLANTNELVWTDGASLPQEGRAFADTQTPYWRIGKQHLAKIDPVNKGIVYHASASSGICYRFVTDADEITLRWSLSNPKLGFPHMAATGVSGLDIYEWTKEKGWRFVNWRFVIPRNYPERQTGNIYTIKWTPGRPCWIYLPLYNGLSDFAVGVAKGKKIEPLPVRASGVTKPVVFYGSSITQGACASRPGMAFTAIAGRQGDFPVVNLGFSGSAHLELEVCDMLADIDASCYVIDPLGNVLHGPGELEARYEKFVRRLHAARPGVPIILTPPGGGAVGRPSPGVAKAHAIFEKLKKESPAEWSRLYWIAEDELEIDDDEYTVDGCHPNDWGMMQMGRAYARTVRLALGLDFGASKPLDVGSSLQVLWDDYLVDLPKTTAVLTPHQAEYVDTVMTFDRKWEGDNCNYKTLIEDVDEKGKLYRMYYLAWYSGNAKPGSPTYAPGRRVCYIESRDGIHWTRPNLGICTFEGSRDNNIIADADTLGIGGKRVELWDCFIVAKDPRPDCPSAERYKATGLTLQWNGEKKQWNIPGLACWISADGIHFTYGWKHEGLTGIIGDSMNVTFWDPKRKIWHFYGRGSHKETKEMDREGLDGVRDVRHSWSKDCRKWESVPQRLDFGPGAEDYGLYTNQIEPYFRNPDILIGFPSRYVERLKWNASFERLCGVEARRARSGKEYKVRLGRAITDCIFIFSREGGTKFTRCDEAFMRPGPEHERNWVYGSCYPAYHVVTSPRRRGDDPVLTWYTEVGHFSGAAADLDRYCLRVDGFFSYRAKYNRSHPATLVTKPLVFTGDTFSMNFSTSARGGVYVTIRDADGRSIRSCEQFGDTIERVVDFEGGKVADFAGKPVTIRFDMSDADLYSFRFTDKVRGKNK